MYVRMEHLTCTDKTSYKNKTENRYKGVCYDT